MIDFQQARTNMVDCQIRPNNVTDLQVLKAFSTVPREEFVPARNRELAYVDEDIAVHADEVGAIDRYLMDPMSMAQLISLAGVEIDDIVLDIGCASGYSTAILSQLCNSVVALEVDETLARQAGERLTELDFDNAVVVGGPLESGYPDEGPYDVIFIGGAVDFVPETLFSQMKEGGRLVVVEGHGNAGVARLYVKNNGLASGRSSFNCAVKPLPGFQAEEVFAL
jgi:protein-L-isoaspartate(D-aspartate) O-methyltransferase